MTFIKKLFLFFITAIVITLSLAVASSCKPDDFEEMPGIANIKVYAPDGAPALSIANMLAENKKLGGEEVDYEIVDAQTIQTFVTGNSPKADICILPVNLAVKLLGDGETYKLLGTVTHGNLFLLSNGKTSITPDNIAELTGKTVGVLNLAQIPGLTLKLILKNADLLDKVTLVPVTAPEVGVRDGIDYFVVPEPAASTKVNALENLRFSGSLQELYGGEAGYPQAVAVAKKELIDTDSVKNFVKGLKENAEWLLNESTSAEEIVSAVQAHLSDGLSPTFSAKNLSKQVIRNCSVNFVPATDCKQDIIEFIAKLNGVSDTSFGTPSDEFFA